MRHYCTYFDRNYLARALAMYESLSACECEFLLDVLCLDSETAGLLARLALPHVAFYSLVELERYDPALQLARTNRSWVEYVWTLTPSVIQHSLRRNPTAEWVTYLDADLMFYSSPEPVFADMIGCSVGVIPHRFYANVKSQEANHGVYNVGMVPFRRGPVALAALSWWREQCLRACHASAQNGQFGDQKYLDDWPERFPGVRVIDHPGANLAPWNVGGHRVEAVAGRLVVDGQPLIFYHFHKLDVFGPHWYRCGIAGVSRRNVDLIYRPYIHSLRRAYARIRRVEPDFVGGIAPANLAAVWRWFRYRRLHFIHEP